MIHGHELRWENAGGRMGAGQRGIKRRETNKNKSSEKKTFLALNIKLSNLIKDNSYYLLLDIPVLIKD